MESDIQTLGFKTQPMNQSVWVEDGDKIKAKNKKYHGNIMFFGKVQNDNTMVFLSIS